MAILYKANETQFNHLGLGPLNDAVSILVTEERNGIFELEMNYPVSGKVFHELKNDRIIKADAGHKLKDQRFKIIRISKPLKGIVTVYAEHVSYLTQDLALKPKVTFNGNTRQALEHWKANLVDDNPLTVWSDISTTGKINWSIDEVENARRALGGVQGSILDVYGGEYLFDNYDIYLYQKRGVNSELLIAYGRNLVDLEQEEEIANTYTSIYPYSIYTDDDGNERMVTLPEYYIDSEHVDKYARRKMLVVDFTTDEIETVSALRSASRRYIKDNDVGVPKVNLKIQYVDLAKTLDYKHLALYEEVNLCDNVMIYFEKYDINTTAKVIKVVWDVLNERYDSIEVGEARASLSQAIDTVVDGKVHNVEKLAMQTLRTADGKNTIYFGLEEPLATEYPLKKNDIWYRIVDGEFTRTYIYDGVVWKLVIDMDSQEAKQEAQQAKDRADDAVNRANQATEDANNAIAQAQTSFDLAQESLMLGQGLTSRMSDAESNLTVLQQTSTSLAGRLSDAEGNLTTLTAAVNGLQTTVSDIDGNVANLTVISNAMQARLTDAEGNINKLTLTSQSMQSTISSLQDDWDNLEVGGTNLVLDSEKEKTLNNTFSAWYLSERFFSEYDTSDDFIISFDAKADTKDEILRVYTTSGNIRTQGLVPLTTEWKRYEVVADFSGIEFERIAFHTGGIGGATNFRGYVRKIKLEKGNKATDWSPALEDLATQSQITQLSGAINLRVTKGDVINQINLDTSGVLISGKKLILDGDTTVLGTFKVDGSAHIKDASIGTAQIGTIDAAIANIINISANNIVGGILQSQNSNTYMNLNTGEWYKENSNITLGGGANINFTNAGNKLQYDLNGRKSGVAFTTAIGGKYPLVALGVTTRNSDLSITDEARFSGFIANGRARYDSDGILNSVVGLRFDVRDESIDFGRGFTFRLGSTSVFRGMSTGAYDYDLGESGSPFRAIYLQRRIYGYSDLEIRNTSNTSKGWRFETAESGNGDAITLRGLNAGSYNYQIGSDRVPSRILNIYLRYNPDVSSDERLKTDIHDLELGLDFINKIEVKSFRQKLTDADINQGITKNKIQYGVMAQQVLSVLQDDGIQDQSLITGSEDDYYGASYEQFVAPLIKSVQELDTKFTDDVNYLKLKVQYLEQKIKHLEGAA